MHLVSFTASSPISAEVGSALIEKTIANAQELTSKIEDPLFYKQNAIIHFLNNRS